MKKETVIIFTKYLLDFMYFAGIAVTVLLPVPGLVQRVAAFLDFHDFEGRYTEIIMIYFILGILAVLILGELRKMFRTVLKDDCFDSALYDDRHAGPGAGLYHSGAVQQSARLCV